VGEEQPGGAIVGVVRHGGADEAVGPLLGKLHPYRCSDTPTGRQNGRPTVSITEYQRHELFTWFEEQMGKERASTTMNLVPPVGWGDVATTRDLELHRAETKHDLLELRTAVGAELAATRHELREEVTTTRHELHDEIVATREQISAMEARLGRTFAGWLFASQAAVMGAMAVLLAIQ